MSVTRSAIDWLRCDLESANAANADHDPYVDTVLTNRSGGCTTQRMAEEYEIPTSTRAADLYMAAVGRKQFTRAHALVFRAAEVVREATLYQLRQSDGRVLRDKLLALAAISCRWFDSVKIRETRTGDGTWK